MNHRFSLLVAVAALFLLSPPSSTIAAPADIFRCRPGVHLSKEHQLTDAQLKTLLEGLRFWTGFNEISFDAAADFTLGNRTQITKGSATARQLISAAVDGKDSFTIENQDHSRAIAFARLQADFDCQGETGIVRHGWQVQIDFSDFNELQGDQYVLAAFDPAINVLHELVHGVLGYSDLVDANDQVGQCERYVNRMRAELGLPVRGRYYARKKIVVPGDLLTEVAQGQLVFIDSISVSKKRRESIVWFNLKGVVAIRMPK